MGAEPSAGLIGTGRQGPPPLSPEQDQALREELAERAEAFSQKYLMQPATIAVQAMQELAKETGREDLLLPFSNTFVQSLEEVVSGVGETGYINPQAVARIKRTRQGLEGYANGEGLLSGISHAARAQAAIAGAALDSVITLIDGTEIHDEVVAPAMQRFGP